MVTMSAYSQFGYAYPTPGQQVRYNNENVQFVISIVLILPSISHSTVYNKIKNVV